jgi:hypothetical protein
MDISRSIVGAVAGAGTAKGISLRTTLDLCIRKTRNNVMLLAN